MICCRLVRESDEVSCDNSEANGVVLASQHHEPMSKNHTYVLGINAYDHDVSACLLRDGEIAYGIEKERLTRQKHAGGFFQEVVDYCLQAEGITLDDVDLVVRNCYVLPVEELEVRLIYQGDMNDREGEQAA